MFKREGKMTRSVDPTNNRTIHSRQNKNIRLSPVRGSKTLKVKEEDCVDKNDKEIIEQYIYEHGAVL